MSFKEILSVQKNVSKDRLAALYADFRHLKKYSPEGYDANVQVWMSALSTAVKDGVLENNDSVLVLDINSQLLSQVSIAPWGRPHGLGSVMHDALSQREWIPLDTFLNGHESIYEHAWSVAGALGWIWKKLVEYSSGSDEDPLPAGRFVLRSNVEDAASKILERAKSLTTTYVDTIYSPETFAKTFSPLFPRSLTKLDQLILLKYLSRDKKEIMCSQTTIKFRLGDKLTPITSSDTSIAHLKTVRLSLTDQISLLTTQSQSLNLKAREALSNKSRILALAALKSRKLTESALQKRSDALSKIEEVLSSVEQCISDAQVLKSLESGASALERLNRDIGGIEKVERIMERVRQGVEQSEDIGRVIAEMGAGARIDDEDVQDEYDEMVKAEEKERIAALEREAEKEKEAEREKLEREKTEKVVEDLKNVSLNPSEENLEDNRQEQALEGLIAT